MHVHGEHRLRVDDSLSRYDVTRATHRAHHFHGGSGRIWDADGTVELEGASQHNCCSKNVSYAEASKIIILFYSD